ncbi:CLL_collapsed_G0029310.mRNA.1.CDS.1 [Saccharomyces cerevisiae]|nr:CLL_collapsed_G0029310.mRNA.1.CDS.1 [Saccharomyces cerevisiae]
MTVKSLSSDNDSGDNYWDEPLLHHHGYYYPSDFTDHYYYTKSVELQKQCIYLSNGKYINPLHNSSKEVSRKRLSYLLDKFELFQYLNSKKEILANKNVPYRDFYNSRKVDRDLSLSGCISQRQLSEYIWEKINLEPERMVL